MHTSVMHPYIRGFIIFFLRSSDAMRSLDRPSPAPCYVLVWVLFVGLLAPL